MADEKIVTWRDATEGLSDAEKLALFEQAAALGIRADDPIWILVLGVRQAEQAKAWAGQAAQAAGEAADRVREAIHSLPEKIKESAGAGVEAVKETVGSAGAAAAEEVKDAGMMVGKALVQAIRKESETFKSEINLSAKSKKEETLEELKSDLSSAVNSAMKTRFTSTLLISVLLILATIIGSGIGGYIYGAKLPPNSCVSGENFFSERSGKHWCVRRIP